MTRLNLRDIEQQNYLNGNAYDWYGEATRPGLRQNYNVNISGGIGKTKYYWSLGYTDNQGYIKEMSIKQSVPELMQIPK